MQNLLKKYPDFNKIFMRFKLDVIKKGDSMPLDYIMALPK